jgi:hypothetical protein
MTANPPEINNTIYQLEPPPLISGMIPQKIKSIAPSVPTTCGPNGV